MMPRTMSRLSLTPPFEHDGDVDNNQPDPCIHNNSNNNNNDDELAALTTTAADSRSNNAPRTLDEFFQTAYNDSSSGKRRRQDTPLDTNALTTTPWRFLLMITALGLSSAADAAEMFSIGYVLADPQFQTHFLRGNLQTSGAAISGILNLGLIVGGLAAGAAEGTLGRKQVLLQGLAFTTAAGLLCAAAPNVAWMIVWRFAAGLGIGPVLAATAPLATEISPPRQRGFIVSMANSFWTVGLIFNAIVAYFIFEVYKANNWRLYMVLTTMPSLVGGILIWMTVPESPRFLALQGKYQQAAAAANQTARALEYHNHHGGSPLLAVEVEHYYGDYYSNTVNHQDSRNPSSSLRDKLRTGWQQVRAVYQKNDWKPIVMVQVLWIAAAIGGSLGQWINVIFHKVHLPHIYLCFIFLNCTCIPGNIASAALTDRWGRTKFFTASMLMAGLSLLAVATIVAKSNGNSTNDDDDDDDDDKAASNDEALAQRTASILFFTSFFYASMTGIYTVLYVMAAELFPTNVRSTGVALCSTWGRIASVFAMFMNGALVDTPAVLLGVGAMVLLAAGSLSMIVPPKEMKAKPVADQSTPPPSAEESPSQQHPQDGEMAVHRKPSQIKYLAG